MPFDVASVRGQFPTLGDGWIHMDARDGMQIPASVATAWTEAVTAFPVSPRGLSPQAVAAAGTETAARQAVADLLEADPGGIVFAPSRNALITALADALPRAVWEGEIILSRLDDESNIVPWLRAARRYGAQVRWAEVDVTDGTLPPWQFEDLINDRTTLIAVTLATSTTGAITDIGQIAGYARGSGALLVVDASSAAPYVRVDIAETGADAVLVSPERWGGPRMAAMALADPSVLADWSSVSLQPGESGPRRLEPELVGAPELAALVASVEHLAGLDPSAAGDRRARLTGSMDELYEYLQRLTFYLVNALQHLGRVQVIGPDAHRVPVVTFTVDGVPAEQVCRRLADNGISALHDVPNRALVRIGVADFGGAVTVALAPYSTPYEVDQLARALGSFG
ncbi:MAG: aminotransferase class V-fold PLP-dependent enzyme [Gordonia sp. (in: high G+C Gram-positive bacteria)]